MLTRKLYNHKYIIEIISNKKKTQEKKVWILITNKSNDSIITSG
jgi:hypothetical protein